MLDSHSQFQDSACRGAWPSAECEGKTQYQSKAAAVSRIRYQAKRGFRRESGFRKEAKLSPYHCPHCGSWHVGATVPRGKKK